MNMWTIVKAGLLLTIVNKRFLLTIVSETRNVALYMKLKRCEIFYKTTQW